MQCGERDWVSSHGAPVWMGKHDCPDQYARRTWLSMVVHPFEEVFCCCSAPAPAQARTCACIRLGGSYRAVSGTVWIHGRVWKHGATVLGVTAKAVNLVQART